MTMKRILALIFSLQAFLGASDTPPVDHQLHGQVEVGPILFTANMEGEDFVYSSSGTVASLPQPYNWGFKVLLGSYWDETLFNLNAKYTRFTTSNTKTLESDLAALQPLWTLSNSSLTNLNHAAASNSLVFNTIDLELGFNCNLQNLVCFRPYLGLKGDFITQDYSVDYATLANQSSMSQSQMSRGIGIRGGLDMNYFFIPRLSLVASIAAATVWNDTTLSRKDYYNATQTLNVSQKIFEVDPVLEAAIGLSYNHWLYDNKLRFRASILWENQVFFNFSHFIMLSNNFGANTLSLMGYSLMVALDF